MRAPDIPARWVNRVAGDLSEADVPLIAAWYGGVAHMISTHEPLDGYGYRAGLAYAQFERVPDAAEAAPTDLRVEQVGSQGGLHFARPVATAFGIPEGPLRFLPGRPGWTCLVAFAGDDAVAAGALFVEGDEGYLTLGGTLPAARGRGAQSALLAERVAVAGRLGLRAVTTETGADGGPSFRNILATGFREVGEIRNWDSPAGSTTA